MRLRPDIFALHCELAAARADLLPVYKEKMIAAAAGALADGEPNATAAYRHLLDDADFDRALARAVRIRQRRDADTFDRIVRILKADMVSCARWMATVCRGRPVRRRPSRRNR